MASDPTNPFVPVTDVVADIVDWIHEHFSDPALSRELRDDLGIDSETDSDKPLPTGERVRMRHPNGEPVDVDKEAFEATLAQISEAYRLLADYFGGATTHGVWDTLFLLGQLGAAESLRARWPTLHALLKALGIVGGIGSRDDVEVIDVFRSIDLFGGRSKVGSDVVDPSGLEGLRNWVALALTGVQNAKPLVPGALAEYGFDPEPTSTTPVADGIARAAFSLDVSIGEHHFAVTVIYLPEPEPTRVHLALGVGLAYTEGRFRAAIEVSGAVNLLWTYPWEWDAGPGETVIASAAYGSLEATALELGERDGSHALVESVKLRVELSATSSVRLALEGVDLALSLGDADNFLASLGQSLKTRFDLALVYDKAGLRFEGGPGTKPKRELADTSSRTVTASPSDSRDVPLPTAPRSGLEVVVPVDRAVFGGFRIHSARAAIGPSSEAGRHTSFELSVTASVALGPCRLTLDRIGLQAHLRAGGVAPNLGLVDLDHGFKPPDGIALEIDEAMVRGSGFLFSDPARGQYAGAIQLEASGLELKAFGLLTTKLPGGARGFSLLIIISADFTPVPLGLGFSLTRVGGLVGINRTASVDALRAGLKAGSLPAILSDPTARPEQLVASVSSMFPVVQGRHVFGPIARIVWGTPTLITIDVCLVLEVPAPVRLIVVGRIRTDLPDEEHPIVRLQVDLLGVVDLDRRQASVDATLVDSRVASFPITGDMALRMSWGAQPTFLLAVGGFNPRFLPPPGFPKLERVAIALATGNNPRLRLEAYLALTSNTVQLGARVDLSAKAGPFTVAGFLSFDALVQLDPLAFVVDIAAKLAVKRGSRTILSVSLTLTLSGPEPWHARGRASFSILFFDVSFRFDVTIGSERPPAIPRTVDLARLLLTAIGDVRSWNAQLPAGGESMVSLRRLLDEGDVLAHPLGTLEVRQRVMPLERTLERFGNEVPSGARRFRITRVTVGADPADRADTKPVEDLFAPSQFRALSDQQKLSVPSFERMPSGVRIGDDDVAHGPPSTVEVVFEQRTFGPPGSPSRAPTRAGLDAPTLVALAESAAGATARRGGNGATRRRATPVFAVRPLAEGVLGS